MNKIVERIEREAGLPGLPSILAERLTPTDLQSILLEVYRPRCRQLQPAAGTRRWRIGGLDPEDSQQRQGTPRHQRSG